MNQNPKFIYSDKNIFKCCLVCLSPSPFRTFHYTQQVPLGFFSAKISQICILHDFDNLNSLKLSNVPWLELFWTFSHWWCGLLRRNV